MSALAFGPMVSAQLHGDVLVLTLDNPPVNATSQALRAGLMAALDHSEAEAGIAALVLTGAGKTFVGGADIKEFGQPPMDPILPDVISRIEAFAKPVVAALNGAALGGGLELALGCHARVAAPSARLGLPEVTLGLVPGAGGTQRLPRLTGLAVALEMVAGGKPVTAAAALASGLVDAVAGDCVDAAVSHARSLTGQTTRRTGALSVATETGDLDAMAAKITARARGQQAPQEAVRLVRLAATAPLAEGLAEERATFLRLRDSDEAAALRHVFFAERAAARVEGLDDVAPRPLATIGIAGLGLMGSGIVVAALAAGLKVIGVEQTEEAAAKGRERVAATLQRNVQSGRLSEAERDRQMAQFTTAGTLAALAAADLVIEAVFDDHDVKVTLFRALDGILRPDAVLATNTSYLDPDRIATATAHPERVMGLHFFSPANIMRLIEVVRCAATAPDVLATGLAFAKRLGKLPIVTGVCEGFIGNRLFSAYRRAAEFLVEDGAEPEAIDAAMEAYGMAMGPFAVFDLAGLDIAWARRKRQAATRDPNARYVEIADRLCEAGRFGQKSGRGWYDYASGGRRVDPEVTALIAEARAKKGIVPRAIAASEIVAALIAALAEEGRALLAEGIAARASDIDLVFINGYGFPAHRGGPLFAAGVRG